MKYLKINYVFIILLVLTQNEASQYQELPQESINQIKNQSLQFMNFLVTDINNSSAFSKCQEFLSKYFLFESDDTKLNELLKNWYKMEYPDFSQEEQNTLKEDIQNGIQRILEHDDFSEFRVLQLMEQLRSQYTKKFLSIVKNHDYKNKNKPLNLKFDFQQIIFVQLKKMDETEKTTQLFKNVKLVHNNFLNEVKEIYKYERNIDIMLKKAEFLMIKNIQDSNILNKYGIRFEQLIDVWMGYYQYHNNIPNLENFEQTIKLMKNYVLNRNLKLKPMNQIVLTYIVVLYKYNKDLANKFMIDYLKLNINPSGNFQDSYYIKYLQNFWVKNQEFNFIEEINQQKQYNHQELQLLDFVILNNNDFTNNDYLIIQQTFMRISDYNSRFINQNILLLMIGRFVCDQDKEYNQQMINMINEFRIISIKKNFISDDMNTLFDFNNYLNNIIKVTKDIDIIQYYPLLKLQVYSFIFANNNLSQDFGFNFKFTMPVYYDNLEEYINKTLPIVQGCQSSLYTATVLLRLFIEDSQNLSDQDLYKYYLTKQINILTAQQLNNSALDFKVVLKTDKLNKKTLLKPLQFRSNVPVQQFIQELNREEISKDKSFNQQNQNVIVLDNQNIIKTYEQELPEQIQETLKSDNLQQTFKKLAQQDEDGLVKIRVGNKIYRISYYQVIKRTSNCMEEYFNREQKKLQQTFNIII